MKNTKYDKIADNHKASETRFKNAIVSFIIWLGVFVCAQFVNRIELRSPCIQRQTKLVYSLDASIILSICEMYQKYICFQS